MISCFGPSIRTNRWMGLYESIAQSGIDFDLTMIGPAEPDFKLPKNLKYIKTYVKPAQCVEIGYRASGGELVMPVADDEIFIGDAVASVYKQYRELNNENLLVSFRYVLNGVDISSCALPANRYFVWQPTSPLAPICPLMSRKLWQKVGGVDRRFLALYWDMDLSMRVFETAGLNALETHKLLSPDAKVEEVGQSVGGGEHSLYNKYGPPYDRRVLDSFWTHPLSGGRQVLEKRTWSVESFEDEDILTKTQGVKGQWQ